MSRIGIDLGGTKIEVAALDAAGRILHRERVDTPNGDYRGSLQAIAGLVESTELALNTRCSVGIGIPGSLSPATDLVRNANSTCLNGMPLKQDIEALLEREIRLANDANCFALSETVDGAGKGYDTLFGVIIGTGTGGGLVVDGRIIEGHNLLGGEWGHNQLPWMSVEEFPGHDCWCGKSGCIETWLSGPGLSAHFRHATGKQLGAKEVVVMATRGDTAAEMMLDRYCDWLARGLASVINIIDPSAIVLGGGMSNIEQLYEKVPGLLPNYVFSDVTTTPVLKAQHGDSSGVRGAAWLWPAG